MLFAIQKKKYTNVIVLLFLGDGLLSFPVLFSHHRGCPHNPPRRIHHPRLHGSRRLWQLLASTLYTYAHMYTCTSTREINML